jgi:DNA-binding response OmpR family regulator
MKGRGTMSDNPVILLADDEEVIRILLTPMLQEQGYSVLSASNGQEALELSRRHPGTIDLLITDVDMPLLKGTDLCAQLLKERPGIKVILMSGAAKNGTINLPFLPKPFDGQALLARVRAILDAPRALSEARE